MNHIFENIETLKFIKYNQYIAGNFQCKKCIKCNFTIAYIIGFVRFEAYYYNNYEIYNEFISYDILNKEVKLTCEEFIIKNIIE